MVVLIRRMLFPLIRKYFRLFASMVAVSCMGIALMVGLRGAFSALEQGFSDYLDAYGYADACITTGPAPTSSRNLSASRRCSLLRSSKFLP